MTVDQTRKVYSVQKTKTPILYTCIYNTTVLQMYMYIWYMYMHVHQKQIFYEPFPYLSSSLLQWDTLTRHSALCRALWHGPSHYTRGWDTSSPYWPPLVCMVYACAS